MLYSIEVTNRACRAATGYLVRSIELVRQYAKNHRRDQPSLSRPRSLRRRDLPIARPAPTPFTVSPPAPSQSMEELFSNRKRKPDEQLSPMSRAKRQDHGCSKSSPWSQDAWAQHLATNIDIKLENACNKHYKRWNRRRLQRKQYTLHGIRYQRSPSPKITKPYRIGLLPHRPDHFEQAYHNLSRPEHYEKFQTPKGSRTPERFVTPDEYPSDQEMSDAEADPLQLDIDEEVLEKTSFAFVQPKETTDLVDNDIPTSPGEPEEQEELEPDEEEDSDWDEDGEAQHRKMLRSLEISYDEEGYRVLIDGTISPESQLWNEDHKRKLHERAALEQQTPSKPPKHSALPPTTASPKLSASPKVALSDGAVVENDAHTGQLEQEPVISPKITVKNEEKEGGPQTPQTPGVIPTATSSTSKILTNGDVPAVKQEDREEGKYLKTPLSPSTIGAHTVVKSKDSVIKADSPEETQVAQAPLTDSALPATFRELSLETPQQIRTPKSGNFMKAQTARKTRLQKLLAEIEEAKNAYPLVPLSKTWDDKVRHAVNHGHGRFEAKMFNKCVPEYSTDPTARSLWLDDAVINDYVAMVAKHGSKDDRKDQVRSVAALSSFFFTKISSPSVNYSSCAGMLKRAGIPGKKLLDCEKIFIPINRSYHWTLAVIEPKIPEGLIAKDHKRKVIVYNSMGSSGGYAVAEIIMRWIRAELGASFKEEEWVIDPAGESPQQRNTDDCGVFTCTTARQIMLRKYDNAADRYKEGDIRDMRKRIVAELVNGDLLNREESSK